MPDTSRFGDPPPVTTSRFGDRPPPEALAFGAALTGNAPPPPGQFGSAAGPRAFEEAVELFDPISQGMTFGFSDEILAPLVAASTGETREEALERIRSRSARIREERPGATLAAEVGGGLAVASRLGLVGGAVARAVPVVRNLPTLARFGLGGAGAGALAGAGTAESGLEPTGRGALEGAVAGGTLGVVLPIAARAAAAALTPLFNRVSGPIRQALERLQRALSRDEVTVEQARDELQSLGVNATIADVGGENVRGLARAAQSIPGQGRNLGRQVLGERQAGQSERVAESINEALGAGTEFRLSRDQLINNRRTAAAPLYKAAYKADIPLTDEMRGMLNRPAIKDAYRTGLVDARNEGIELTPIFDDAGNLLPGPRQISTQTLDYIQRGLTDAVRGERNTITGAIETNTGRVIDSLRRNLMREVDAANPAFAAARAVYAGDSASIDALNQGRRLGQSLNRRGEEFDPEQIYADLEKMNDAEKAFFRQGLSRGLLDAVEATSDTADAVKRLVGNEARRGRLRAAFPSGEAFTRFMSDMNRELRFFNTRGEVLQNSITQRLAAEQADLLTNAPGTFQNPLRGGLVESAGRGGTAIVNRLRRPSPELAGEIGNIMFAQGPEATRLLSLVGTPQAIPPILQRSALTGLIEAERQAGTSR